MGMDTDGFQQFSTLERPVPIGYDCSPTRSSIWIPCSVAYKLSCTRRRGTGPLAHDEQVLAGFATRGMGFARLVVVRDSGITTSARRSRGKNELSGGRGIYYMVVPWHVRAEETGGGFMYGHHQSR